MLHLLGKQPLQSCSTAHLARCLNPRAPGINVPYQAGLSFHAAWTYVSTSNADVSTIEEWLDPANPLGSSGMSLMLQKVAASVGS